MTQKPKTRRKFRSPGDEANYLNEMIAWLYRHDERAEALMLCDRLEKLLKPRGLDDGSIMLQDHWALVSEVRGTIEKAIRHREREIALIKRALKLGGPIGPVNYHFLSERMAILARLYEQLGDRQEEAVGAGGSKR